MKKIENNIFATANGGDVGALAAYCADNCAAAHCSGKEQHFPLLREKLHAITANLHDNAAVRGRFAALAAAADADPRSIAPKDVYAAICDNWDTVGDYDATHAALYALYSMGGVMLPDGDAHSGVSS